MAIQEGQDVLGMKQSNNIINSLIINRIAGEAGFLNGF
jgi:hypothetical protein